MSITGQGQHVPTATCTSTAHHLAATQCLAELEKLVRIVGYYTGNAVCQGVHCMTTHLVYMLDDLLDTQPSHP